MNWLLVICPLGFILLLAFFLFVSINIWKTYRSLDWKQAAIFSTTFFFIAGSLSLALNSNSDKTQTAMWSITSESDSGGGRSTLWIKREAHLNSFTGRGRDKKGIFTLVGAFYGSDRIEFNKIYSFKKGSRNQIVTVIGNIQNNRGRALFKGNSRWTIPDEHPWPHGGRSLIAKDHCVGDLGSYANFQRFFAQY